MGDSAGSGGFPAPFNFGGVNPGVQNPAGMPIMTNTIPNQADGSQEEPISDVQWIRQIMTMMSEQQRTLNIAISHMAGTQFKKTQLQSDPRRAFFGGFSS